MRMQKAGFSLASRPGAEIRILAAMVNGELVQLLPGYDVRATDFEGAICILYPSRRCLQLKARVFIDCLAGRCK